MIIYNTKMFVSLRNFELRLVRLRKEDDCSELGRLATPYHDWVEFVVCHK